MPVLRVTAVSIIPTVNREALAAVDRPGGKMTRSRGDASPRARHRGGRSSVFRVSSCRTDEQVNGRFQKHTLLITKKLSIDLLFLRGKYHYRDL